MKNIFEKYGFKASENYANSFESKNTALGHVVITDRKNRLVVNFMSLDEKNISTKNDLFSGSLQKSQTIKSIYGEPSREYLKESLEEFLNNLLYLKNPYLAKLMYQETNV